jgi:DNA end-binding protein Ku
MRDRLGSIQAALPVCMEYVVAPRAYWKGYLKLSLVSCPVALFPASSEREKISFNQINKKTGNRIRYRKVDAETGDEVDSSDIIKGYEVGKGQYGLHPVPKTPS